MRIEDHWLDDHRLAQISSQRPSTAWGAELMREAWPKRYPRLLSSDTYRGCAIVLSMLLAHMRPGISVGEVQQLVLGADQSLKESASLQANSDLCGAAVLTITNAWTTAAELGFTTSQIAAAYESELIYEARMFVLARQRGM